MSEKSKKPKEFAITRIKLEVDKTLKSDYVVDSLEKAIYLINDYLSDSPNEYSFVIMLDKNKNPISSCILGMGNSGHVDVNNKDVFASVLSSGADSFVMVHNHPNATNLEPSNVDIQTFNELFALSNKLNLNLRDCIITGNYKQNHAYYSWFEKKVITQYEFLKNLKNIKLEKPLEVVDSSDKTLDEVNGLLAESEYNSEKTSSTQKSSNGLFNVFK